MFGDQYGISEEVLRRAHSPAFRGFLHHWFEDTWALTRGEVDLTFLEGLTAEEREIAKDILRRNLHLKYNHIIEGVAALGDLTAIPTLKAMLAEEPDPSRQLTIAGTLWKLNRDEVFVECLQRMKTSDIPHLKSAHFNQVMWLGDERAVDFLIEFLDDEDHFIRFLALSALNSIEHQQHFHVPESKLPSHPILYRSRRFNPEFRAMMVTNLQARNAAMTNGW